MDIVIEIQNKTKIKVPSRRFFISAAERVLKITNNNPPGNTRSKQQKTNIGGDVEISLVFVANRRMQRLNKLYRGKDKPTDVLSFPNFIPLKRKNPKRLGNIIPTPDPDGMVRLGEIIIAPTVAGREATLYGHTVAWHYIFLFVHGLLHLLGYDHETSRKDEMEMQKVQQQVMLNLK